jgi:hypothetical protein
MLDQASDCFSLITMERDFILPARTSTFALRILRSGRHDGIVPSTVAQLFASDRRFASSLLVLLCLYGSTLRSQFGCRSPLPVGLTSSTILPASCQGPHRSSSQVEVLYGETTAARNASDMIRSPQHDSDSYHQNAAIAEPTRIPVQAILTLSASPSERFHVVPHRPGTSEPDWVHLRRFDLGMVLKDNRSLQRDLEQVRSKLRFCHDPLITSHSKHGRSKG